MPVADARTLERLEFNKILERLARHVSSPLGREGALALTPTSDLASITRMLAETGEAVLLLRLDPTAELGGWYDVRESLAKAERGAVLEGEALSRIGLTLGAVQRIKKFFKERGERYPILSRRASSLISFPEIEQQIRKAILPGGEVADEATPRLADLRRRIQQMRLQVKEYLEKVIRSASYQKFLQEPIVTIREGRYVLPVKHEYRNQVPGLVHDQSASGATLFIEPMAVVEKNNEIRRLEAAEKQEVFRILSELTAKVGGVVSDIYLDIEILGFIDLAMAKGMLAGELRAVSPEVREGAFLSFRSARHPLIKGEAVPISCSIGVDYDTLVLTGPNTGGKTVALKTVGLMVLMAQAGLFVPAEECRLGVFTRVFADIGDEQSIENELSTFSSHVRNVVEILSEADAGSLVLIDELGTGTDPTEGAALAQAVLTELHGRRAKTVATSHFGELKHLAATHPRIQNASVEFDFETLKPTYRLIVGRPGRSNAFEIARRLGLPDRLVQTARSYLADEQLRAEELLGQLERMQREADIAREQAMQFREQARKAAEKHESELANLLAKKKTYLEKAAEDAQWALRSLRLESEAIIRELREKLRSDSERDRQLAIQEARQRIDRLNEMVPQVQYVPPSETQRPVSVGDTVHLPRFGQFGQVVAIGKDGEAQVQVGAVKLSVPLSEIRLAKDQPRPRQEKRRDVAFEKACDFSIELDLRGHRVDEALLEVEKYLDDAVLAGASRVYLIHGKGTGALRSAVQQLLKENRHVKSFRLGDQGEGGSGVTVVDIKGA
ncbi:MAG: endonuclease MutS2 [Bacillota bacterium]